MLASKEIQSPEDLLRECCDLYNIPLERLLNVKSGGKKDMVRIKQMFSFLSREVFLIKVKVAGAVIGANYSSVCHGRNKMRDYIESGQITPLEKSFIAHCGGARFVNAPMKWIGHQKFNLNEKLDEIISDISNEKRKHGINKLVFEYCISIIEKHKEPEPNPELELETELELT